MPDLATGELNSIERKIKLLNATEVSTPAEALEVLKELKKVGGKLVKGSVLEKGIENYIGELDVYSVPTVIDALEKFNKTNINDFDTSAVPVAKINELVEDYQEYLDKGLDDKSAVEKIYQENKGSISKNNIEEFVKRQKEIYQENLKRIDKLKPKESEKKVVDLNKYKQEKQEVEKEIEIISKEQFKLENKIEAELNRFQESKAETNKQDLKEELSKVSKQISEKAFEAAIISKETPEKIAREIISELPYSVIKPEEKQKFEADLREQIDTVKSNIIVELKTEEITRKIVEELKKEDRIEEIVKRNNEVVEEKIRSAVKNVVLGEEIITETQQVNDLNSEIIKILKSEDNSPISQEPPINKTAIKSLDLELNKWAETNNASVQKFRGESLENSIELQIYQENPNLTNEQKIQVENYKQLIKEIYYSGNLDKYKNDAVNAAQSNASPGQINNAWTDLKGITNLLKKSPGDVNNTLDKYNTIKKGLGDIKLPFNIKECRSFENISNLLTDPQLGGLFNRTQKYLAFFEKADRFTGGLLGRVGMKAANYFVERIGNQAIKAFAENSLKILAEKGLQQGFGIILKGILSGGVQAGAGAAAAGGAAATGAVVAGGAALSATGVGVIIVAALAALSVVKKIKDKIVDALGIRLVDTKAFFQDTFGKGLGGIINFVVGIGASIGSIGAIGVAASSTAVLPIIIGVFVFLFGYQMLQGSMISSLVPPPSQQYVYGVGASGSGYIEPFDPSAIRELDLHFNVPVIGQEFTRDDLVRVAKSILGLPYFWGGKYPHKGANPNWGKLTTVWADGSWETGRALPLGLDCTGYVDWVYYQLIGRRISNGGVMFYNIYNERTAVTRDQLKVGDVGIYKNGDSYHVGIYIGRDPADNEPLFIQASGQTYRSNARGLVAGQVLILKEGIPFNGYVGGTRFNYYARPEVHFKDDN